MHLKSQAAEHTWVSCHSLVVNRHSELCSRTLSQGSTTVKTFQHWRRQVLLYSPLRSLLKSWSLRISPSSLFLMAFSRASRLEDDFSRFLYASETCWISVSSCSGSENKNLLFYHSWLFRFRKEIIFSQVFFIEETYTYTLSKTTASGLWWLLLHKGHQWFKDLDSPSRF